MADANEWEHLGTTELTVAGDNIDVDDIAVKKLIQIIGYSIPTGSDIHTNWNYNLDAGTNYAVRNSKNGLGDSSGGNRDSIRHSESPNVDEPEFQVYEILNVLGEEKLVMGHNVGVEVAGAGTGPERNEVVAKYVPSPDADITKIRSQNTRAGNDYDVGSTVDVAGAEG